MNRMRGTLLVSALLAGLIPLFLLPQPLKAQEEVPDSGEVMKAVTAAAMEDVGEQVRKSWPGSICRSNNSGDTRIG